MVFTAPEPYLDVSAAALGVAVVGTAHTLRAWRGVWFEVTAAAVTATVALATMTCEATGTPLGMRGCWTWLRVLAATRDALVAALLTTVALGPYPGAFLHRAAKQALVVVVAVVHLLAGAGTPGTHAPLVVAAATTAWVVGARAAARHLRGRREVAAPPTKDAALAAWDCGSVVAAAWIAVSPLAAAHYGVPAALLTIGAACGVLIPAAAAWASYRTHFHGEVVAEVALAGQTAP